MNKMFSINNLVYEKSGMRIINNITFEISCDKITLIKGPNGAGKSTLLKLLFGLYIPTSGKIIGHFPKTYEKSIAFQNPVFLNRSVEDNLRHVLYCKNIKKNKWNNIIINHLKQNNLISLKEKKISELSGGELQLTSLVRSLLIRPNILFCDEPTNNLDSYHLDFMIEILNNLKRSDTKIIVVSHDTNLANKIDHEEITLNNGKIQCVE